MESMPRKGGKHKGIHESWRSHQSKVRDTEAVPEIKLNNGK